MRYLFALAFLLNFVAPKKTHCQIAFSSAQEHLVKSDIISSSLIGKFQGSPSFLYSSKKNDSSDIEIRYLDERVLAIKNTEIRAVVSRNRSGSFSNFNSILFYRNLYFKSFEDNGFGKLFIIYSDDILFLDSIYNADKNIHSSFSSDGKLLLVNTLNTLSDYYNPEQDNQIYVYDLSNLENGEIKKSTIPCTHCSDSYLVGDQLFFTIGREDGYGGFANKDIYVAPWGRLEDSVKIASNTNILAISPDGKYILGTRFFDRYKTTAVIIDVEQKKYQLLLGRDYAEYRAFYSYHENKFAFKIKDYLVYIDFPKEYPFDALKWRNEEIPDWTEKEFWAQYVHPPLPD